ncbi:glycoside hydrolase family 104 protein [Paraburkholderia sp. J12]|uniref:glycoside hydrolase family 24 protein n=1 Tax=Paraburkholderia sp. J12 TaxID=2805432 RepID=UPI002ABE8ABF|nr:glycoside hydrolase family 104 protein [Paraburkholderia sp. J12]
MARISIQQAGGANRVAFLDMIAASEIDAWTRSNSDDGYNVLVGAHGPLPSRGVSAALLTFASYATHPNVFNAAMNSTAAGRYQFLSRYWSAYQAQLNLPDFGPISQDLWALQLIRECKALPLIDAGQFASAVFACSSRWASLPGNSYGQRQNDLGVLTTAYQQAGGLVAV